MYLFYKKLRNKIISPLNFLVMRNYRRFRSVGAIAIMIFAASVISMANTSDSDPDLEANPELPALVSLTSWTFLGSREALGKKDSRTIRLSRGFGSMAKIQVRLRFNQIELHQAILHFKNGETQEVELKPNVLGEKIYLINVENGAQKVRKVTVKYSLNDSIENRAFGPLDIIEIWGVRSSYLRSGYNEGYYPVIRYDTFGDIIRREQYGQDGTLVYGPSN